MATELVIQIDSARAQGRAAAEAWADASAEPRWPPGQPAQRKGLKTRDQNSE